MKIKAEMEEIFFDTDKYIIGIWHGGIIVRQKRGSGEEKDIEFELTWNELWELNPFND